MFCISEKNVNFALGLVLKVRRSRTAGFHFFSISLGNPKRTSTFAVGCGKRDEHTEAPVQYPTDGGFKFSSKSFGGLVKTSTFAPESSRDLIKTCDRSGLKT